MKRIILFLVIFAAFIYYVAKNLPTIMETFNVANSTVATYLGFAAIFGGFAYLFMVLMNKKVFALLGIKRSTWEMAKLQLSSLVVNVLIPTAGASIAVLFAEDAKKRNESPIAAVTAILVALFVDYFSIAVFSFFAVLYLYAINQLTAVIFLPALFFFVATFIMFFLIFFATKKEPLIRKGINIFGIIADRLLKIIGKKRKNDHTEDFINELKGANKAISTNTKSVVRSIVYIFISHLFYLGVLYVVFLSLGIHPLYRTLITGYAIGTLFVVVSPTPNGAGFVEGTMALTYSSLGIPSSAAATVSIIYRAFSFWLPLMIGFVIYQKKNLEEISSNIFS